MLDEASRARLRRRVEGWVQRIRVQPRIVRVQRMTRKWGSCSTLGVVTFASDLARQPAEFQDFVIAHELLHLRIRNHGRLFKALLSVHVPGWRRHDLERLAGLGAGRARLANR